MPTQPLKTKESKTVTSKVPTPTAKLVACKDFYKDFIESLKSKKDKITDSMHRYVQERNAIINTFRDHYDTFKEYYIIKKNVVRGGVATVDLVRNYNFDDIVLVITCYSKLKGSNFVPCKEPTQVFKKLIDRKLDQLSDVNFNINLCKCEIDNIKTCMMDYAEYRTASDIYNLWSIKHCLDGGKLIFAKRMGNIVIKKVTRDYSNANTKVKVDIIKSKAYKNTLIASGKIPYNKKDHMAAIAKGEEYKGEDWFIYDYTEQYLFIKWIAGTCSKNLYAFKPTRGNNVFKQKQDMIDVFNKNHDLDFIFGCNLGFVNHLNFLKDVIPGFANKFEEANNYK